MVNFGKPIHEMTVGELNRGIEHWPMEMISVAVLELQRRQQAKHAEEDAARINKLAEEIGTLKKIVETSAITQEKSADSANRTSKYALRIAIAALIAQVLFSGHYDYQCGYYSKDESGVETRSGCSSTFDLGLLGTYTFQRDPVTIN